MKKITLSIVAVLMALTSVFTFAACGQSPEQKLATYVESDTFQKQVDSMKEQFASVLDVKVSAEGSKVIYDFTYKTQIEDSLVAATKETLDTTFQSMSSTYTGIADALKEEVGIENPVVVININNADGKNITTIEFKATK